MKNQKEKFIMKHTDDNISWETAYREYERYCEEHHTENISFDEWKERVNYQMTLETDEDTHPDSVWRYHR